ncbi:MAG: branched-chain amino acid ABC transporter permease, partial [Chloroflexi bacterium]|nr:branched-chain amino acid ABC transporter permease [Chloroflexota bacterium]
MEYFIFLATIIGIYGILTTSYNLLFGYAGLLSVAHAVFYGIGAYTAALALLHLGVSFPVALLLAVVVSALAALLLAAPSLRLTEDYLLVASFGLQVIGYSIFLNWREVTRGPMGLPRIPKPELLGFTLSTSTELLVFVYVVAAICCLIVWRLSHSGFGRVLRALREDEIATIACGKNVTAFKVTVLVVAGALAAVAGALYATYVSFIDPESFTLNES